MGDNPSEVSDISLIEYKFEVCLDRISLHTDKRVECIIKFKYDLFGTEETSYPSFTISSEAENHKIPGYFVFTVSRKKSIDVKKFLEENLLASSTNRRASLSD